MKRSVDVGQLIPVIASLLVLVAAIGVRLPDPAVIDGLRNMAFDQYQRWQPRQIAEAPVQMISASQLYCACSPSSRIGLLDRSAV